MLTTGYAQQEKAARKGIVFLNLHSVTTRARVVAPPSTSLRKDTLARSVDRLRMRTALPGYRHIIVHRYNARPAQPLSPKS